MPIFHLNRHSTFISIEKCSKTEKGQRRKLLYRNTNIQRFHFLCFYKLYILINFTYYLSYGFACVLVLSWYRIWDLKLLVFFVYVNALKRVELLRNPLTKLRTIHYLARVMLRPLFTLGNIFNIHFYIVCFFSLTYELY